MSSYTLARRALVRQASNSIACTACTSPTPSSYFELMNADTSLDSATVAATSSHSKLNAHSEEVLKNTNEKGASVIIDFVGVEPLEQKSAEPPPFRTPNLGLLLTGSEHSA